MKRRRIVALRDWHYAGTHAEKVFVNKWVRSAMKVDPKVARPHEWVSAWTDAEREWQEWVEKFADSLPSHDLDEAEIRARRQLTRKAEIRLRRWSDWPNLD